jgi:hypothetical protein
MRREPGILVVNRFDFMRLAARAGTLRSRKPAVELSPEEVFRRYRGFDGLVWPELEHPEFLTEEGLAELTDWSLVKQYVQKLARPDECDVIVLAALGSRFEDIQRLGWAPAGFDLGYFESEWSHFSVILNEIVFGVHAELRAFAGRLNEHLLFATLEDATATLTERTRLFGLGKDLEQATQVEAIAVFLRQAPNDWSRGTHAVQ